MGTENEVQGEDTLQDVPKEFHGVVHTYGREMFALVHNASMCAQATQVLSTLVQKHQSTHGLHALQILANAFNQLSSDYAKKMGWEEPVLMQCDRDIQLAYKAKIVVPGSAILLN